LTYLVADDLLQRRSSSYAIEHPNDLIQSLLFANSIESTEKGIIIIIIAVDRRDHYSGKGVMNAQAMRFLTDTVPEWPCPVD